MLKGAPLINPLLFANILETIVFRKARSQMYTVWKRSTWLFSSFQFTLKKDNPTDLTDMRPTQGLITGPSMDFHTANTKTVTIKMKTEQPFLRLDCPFPHMTRQKQFHSKTRCDLILQNCSQFEQQARTLTA